MAVLKTFYCCQNCGAQHSKWLGQCSSCKEWNTLVEEVIKKSSKVNLGLNSVQLKSKAQLVNEIDFEKDPRLLVEDKELNRVLGGGIVPGSLVLIGGEPGIGKSTLLLQISLEIKNKVLYITGEESQQQIRRRANRINNDSNQCYVLNETNVETIISQINTIKPELVIIDSIQTLQTDIIDSSPGSVSQIKESASQFLNYSKKTNLPIFLVGHITKDGGIAGPKILEHMVDVVLQFEGDRNNIYRILRAKKNRFGSTAEIGIYEMLNSGLRQVTNPSELLISNNKTPLSGNAIASTMEGIRAILIEVQALVSSAVYGTPQRSTTGFNAKRLNMLLAVLEKRAGFKLSSKDVFLNITGGIKIEDPAMDLAVVAAILSSNFNIPLQKRICFAAEIGLSGELRSVPKIDQRINEAEKLGFEILIVSEAAKISFVPKKLKIISYSRIEDLIKNLFKEQG
ncbi:DNA repair protein RadA [Flavobacteriaceae bacterium]|jgi:DNA repair protein RadA/Sms|nr:DNA repair protein RadA [Flavobacteriaceae bacterium]MDB9849457.1 DNA repair protein RadA [Flavobacteriaceae bacterium]MDB9994979.1 DNA repair protein RadA [Flavobacteriaceae bacterium]MDC0007667.1 DNA repair protein RadA [Flavobacteriaceae bacterium]MDC1337333.1 DNA repair protein RadA [Flavobacteriaceae bacterium]|tara:strand:- start:912 stop:2276 length:1365 start_codon:yes stop_codon:yes gene_type:complete